jgi:hypothetical protein
LAILFSLVVAPVEGIGASGGSLFCKMNAGG